MPSDSTPFAEPWQQLLNELGISRQDIFFVEVGAMDGVSFDPLYAAVVQYRWKGLLIEPLPDLFERLKENYKGITGLLFENMAVAEVLGEKTMYRVAPEAVRQGLVPDWAEGISSFFLDKNALGGRGIHDEDFQKILPHIITERVACDTFGSILEKNKVEKIDVLQVDTEGYDFQVLRQLDFNKYKPSIIRIEECNLSETERKAAIELLAANGYQSAATKMDRIAWREFST